MKRFFAIMALLAITTTVISCTESALDENTPNAIEKEKVEVSPYG